MHAVTDTGFELKVMRFIIALNQCYYKLVILKLDIHPIKMIHADSLALILNYMKIITTKT